METVTSVIDHTITTSIGDYHIPIAVLDSAVTNLFRFDQNQIDRHLWDFFYDGNTQIGVEFTCGSRISGYWENGHYKIKCDDTITDCSVVGGRWYISMLVQGTDDNYGVWALYGSPGACIENNNMFVNDGTVVTPVSSSAFGTMRARNHGSAAYSIYTGDLDRCKSWGNYLIAQVPIVYHWTAWDQIAGNGGQYRCDLTKIKNDSIGDFSAIQTGDETDFTRISSRSSIWNIFHNIGFDQETKIAWSGKNYLTLELKEIPQYPTQYIFKFRFYIWADVQGTLAPFWTDEFPITWTGLTRDTDFYLSFVYDTENTSAIFLPATKNVDGTYEWGWSGGIPSDTVLTNMYIWLNASSSPEANKPYSTGTEDDGGNPGGGMPQSHIDVPTPPTLSAMTSGMFTIYAPTDTELGKISEFLWSDNVIDNIRKYNNNFSDNIMALYVLPYKPSNNPTKAFKVGNMESSDSDLSAVEYIDDRFVQVDMGSVRIKPFWGSYLDYAPYSSLQVVLPGVGVQSLDVDDIFCPADADGNLPAPSESIIHLDYTIDLMTGILVAFISINGEMRYQFPGKIGYQIPLTGDNYVRMAQGFVTAAAGLIGTIASGGAAAPFTASAAAAGIINAMKPDVYRGGNLSGDGSMMARQTPTLIYRRPNKPLLNNQENFTGFPSYKIGKLSEFSGYVEVLDCHVEGFSCTDEEREKILAALKGGVII